MEGLDRIRIPDTLTGVIQARIENLPEQERRILQQASVIGRIFWFEALCYLNDDPAPEVLDAQTIKLELDRLMDRELIFQQERSSLSDSLEYLFKHAVLREVTYEKLLKRMRRMYHRSAADWLIANSAERTEEVSSLIANHLEKAGRVEEALDYYSRAAKTAAANYALEEAAEFYSRALDMASKDDLEKIYDLTRARQGAYSLLGNRDLQQKDIQETARIADFLEDDRRQVEVLVDEAWYCFWIGEYAKGAETGSEAVSRTHELGLEELAGEGYKLLAWIFMQLRKFQQAHDYAKTGLEHVKKTADEKGKTGLLMALALTQANLGNYSEALVSYQTALDLNRSAGKRKVVANNLYNFSVIHTMLGAYDIALEQLQEAERILADYKDRLTAATISLNIAWNYTSMGDWERGLDYLEMPIENLSKMKYYEALAEAYLWSGHCHSGLGKFEEALKDYEKSLALREKIDQQVLAMGVRAGRARTAVEMGELAYAVENVNIILDFLDQGGSLETVWEPLRIYLTCVNVLELTEDERCDALLTEAHTILQDRASRILDENQRRTYLENVSWHREIMDKWANRLKP